ncbi:hypothetical protein MKEN_01457100 [Mycena kentingensis (nom. inval.)]|nr:hypothetical protein MKEN_01457100 [Mycena kentingensis (nom. inval.)]
MAPLPVTLDNTLGAVVLGAVLSTFIYGSSLVQVFYYFQSFPNDGWLYHTSVAVLCTLDTAHSALILAALYIYTLGTVQNSPLFLLGIIWPAKVQVFVVPLIVCIVNACVVGICIFVGFCLAMYAAATVTTLSSWPEALSIAWAFEAAYGISTGVDLLISIAMVYFLSGNKKGKSLSSGLSGRIRLLMQYTLASGILTSLCSLACMVALITMPSNLVFFALTFISTRLYVASFLTMLTMRQRRHRDGLGVSISTNGIGVGGTGTTQRERAATGTVQAYVQRSVVVSRDGEDHLDHDLEFEHPYAHAHAHGQPQGQGQSDSKVDWIAMDEADSVDHVPRYGYGGNGHGAGQAY